MAQTSAENKSAMEEPEDHSLLIKPINVGLSGVQHVLQSVQKGTAEVRDLLINECNLIYECKVCRSLHRSLANFLAHKRIYCTSHICETLMLFSQQDIENETVIVQPESPDSGAAVYEDDPMGDEPNGAPDLEEVVQKVVIASPPKIFIPSIVNDAIRLRSVEKSAASNGVGDVQPNFIAKCMKHLDIRNASRTQTTVKLEPIDDSPVAMSQTVLPSMAVKDIQPSNVAASKSSSKERRSDRSKPTVVKSPQARAMPPSSPAAKSASQSESGWKCCTCFKCGAKFSSVKGMSFHLKTIHAKRRVYFHCPFCKSRFSQVWGVNRHMMSVHKKSKEQASRLRSKIQKSALRRVAADKDSAENSDDDRANNNCQTSPIVSSTVRLTKSMAIHECVKCNKIFADKRTLESHASKCGGLTPKVSCKTGVESSRANERPRRVVKKKEANDFVDSSQLSIGANTVACKGENAIKVPPMVEKKILELVNPERKLCIHCNRTFTSLTNLRRHAAAHIGWNRFKCKHCDYQSYSRSECRNHVKRKHFAKRRMHRQVDSFVIDVPTDEVEKTLANGEFKPVPLPAGSSIKEEPANDAKTAAASTKKAITAKKDVAVPTTTRKSPVEVAVVANRRSSLTATPAPPPSPCFNISTRLSPRTFDTSPYRRSDSAFALVTRSGAYLKADPRPPTDRNESFASVDKQKVLRRKTIQLKPVETSVSSNGSSECSNVSSFSSHGDHNYSVEVKNLEQDGAAEQLE